MGWVLTLIVSGLTVLAAVVPAVVFSLVIWWFDRYEKEPWGLLTATFVWGAIPAIFLALTAELLLDIPFSAVFGQAAGEAIGGGVVAPFVEEVTKAFALLFVFLVFRGEFDDLLDGVVYGALVGFGFGMTEDAFYFVRALWNGGAGNLVTVVLMRTMVFGLKHGLFSSIVGLGFGYASIATTKWKAWLAPPLALGGSIVVHAVHNASTSLAGELGWPVLISLLNHWGGVLVIVIIVFLAWDREKAWIVRELEEEIAAGTITRTEYEIVSSYWGRIAAQWRAFMNHGLRQARQLRRFHQSATELAFVKHRLPVLGDKRRGEAQIGRLREQIKVLRTQILR